MSPFINIILNGKKIAGMPGETIYECASRHGVEIPTLCHDQRLEPHSSCYVCVVEIIGVDGLQPSCSTYITEGMQVNTETVQVREARKAALELLLSNHYADCLAPCAQTNLGNVETQGHTSPIDKSGLSDDAVVLKKEFLSKKENVKFRKADQEKYQHQHKEEKLVTELPTAEMETSSCLEYNCNVFYTCDLKKYATTYEADQKLFAGEFQEFEIDSRHPFIQIDNNKCILCSRCIRICHEMVGANALGLVDRGFKSYVAPTMGLPLQQTSCESCGLCITTCTTGAISEYNDLKMSPLPLETIESIDMFGSEGYEVNLHHHQGEFYGASSRKGEINRMDLINRRQLFGYKLFNSGKRITKPLLKVDGGWKEISFEAAIDTILERVKVVKPDENALFGGARLTNEELYLIQKLARAGVKTNNVGSFHYLGRGDGYFFNSNENASYCDLRGASKIYLVGNEVHLDHPVINHISFNTRFKEGIEIVLLTTRPESRFSKKVDKVIAFKNYYFFIKAVNLYLVKNKLHNAMFIRERTQGWEEYVEELLKCSFDQLLQWAGTTEEVVADFVRDFNEEMNAILVFQEKEISANASMALHNLAMITGKLGKTANGLIALKERNNSHGIFSMGVCQKIGVGVEPILDKDLQYRMAFTWKTEDLPLVVNNVQKLLTDGKIKNALIFGEDPIGCALDKNQMKQMVEQMEFVIVQDIYMSETARMADLVLPASFVWEMGGSFTNSQRKIQAIAKQLQGPVEKTSFQQLTMLLEAFGIAAADSPEETMNEVLTLLPKRGEYKDLHFVYKKHDNYNLLFQHGCDVLMKTINEEFAEKLNW